MNPAIFLKQKITKAAKISLRLLLAACFLLLITPGLRAQISSPTGGATTLSNGNGKGGKPKPTPTPKPAIDPLYVGATGGSWGTAGNWSPPVVPNAIGDTATY